MLQSGDVFAGFTIERLLGQGGMGSVYLARHPRLGKLTALKLLNRELFADREVRARFEREADLVAQLDHPNIVAVYDRGTEDAQLWISMQYVDGVDAASVQVANLPPERAVQIIEGVADALDYAHTTGVLHRDVKPANIMLARSVAGHGERVFLTDFGIARLREDSTHLTQTGMFTATLAYASPEQMTGAHLDHSTDQYSLACALYWLLTGIGPFDSAHPAEIIRGHLQLMPYPASMRRPGISAAMDAVINKAMAKRPVDRFPNCADFAAAARRALKEPPVLPVQSGPTYRYPPNHPAAQQPSPPGYAPAPPAYAAPPQPYPPQGYPAPPQGQGAAQPSHGAPPGQVPAQPSHGAPPNQVAAPPGYVAPPGYPPPAYAAPPQNYSAAPPAAAAPQGYSAAPPIVPPAAAPGYPAAPVAVPSNAPAGQPPQSSDPAQQYAGAVPATPGREPHFSGEKPQSATPAAQSAGPAVEWAAPAAESGGGDFALDDPESATAATEQMVYPGVPQRHPVGVAIPVSPGGSPAEQASEADKAEASVGHGTPTSATTPVGYTVAPHQDPAAPEDSPPPVVESSAGVSFSKHLGMAKAAPVAPEDSVARAGNASAEVPLAKDSEEADAVRAPDGASAESGSVATEVESGTDAGGTESAAAGEAGQDLASTDTDSNDGGVESGSSAERVEPAIDAENVPGAAETGQVLGDPGPVGAGHIPGEPGVGSVFGPAGGVPGAPASYGPQGGQPVGPVAFGPPPYSPNSVPPGRMPSQRPNLGELQPGAVVVLALAGAVLLTLLALLVLSAVG